MQGNGLNLGRLAEVMERGQSDASVFTMHKQVEGQWHFGTDAPAFTTTVAHGERSTSLSVDVAPGFGGNGIAPDPLQYLLTGLAACFSATVVTLASMEGVELEALSASANIDLDVASVYGMGEQSLVSGIAVQVRVTADVDDATLVRWQDTARAKCPFAFTIANPIPLTTIVKRH